MLLMASTQSGAVGEDHPRVFHAMAFFASPGRSRWVVAAAHKPAWAAIFGGLVLSCLTTVADAVARSPGSIEHHGFLRSPEPCKFKTGIGASPPDSSSVFGEKVLAKSAIVLALDPTVRVLVLGVKLCAAGRQTTALSYYQDNAGALTAGLHLSR